MTLIIDGEIREPYYSGPINSGPINRVHPRPPWLDSSVPTFWIRFSVRTLSEPGPSKWAASVHPPGGYYRSRGGVDQDVPITRTLTALVDGYFAGLCPRVVLADGLDDAGADILAHALRR